MKGFQPAPILAALLSTAVCTLTAAHVDAAGPYTFDETCAPLTSHDLGSLQPNVLVILDRSASMNDGSGEDVDGGGEDSKIKVARLTLADVATQNHMPGECPMPTSPGCDGLRLGLGYYAGNSGSSSPDELDAFVAVSPGEDTRDAIVASVSGVTAPGGSGTTTGDAAQRIERDMTDTTRQNFGIIITDGETTRADQQRDAVTALCNARTRATAPVMTFMVGFGAGSDAQNNSLLAAAGGTGTCCVNGAPPCDAPDRRDPCDHDADDIYTSANNRTVMSSGWDCEGSLESNGSTLKDALLAALGSARCTFPLEIPAGYPTPGAMEDPLATRVQIIHQGLSTGVLDTPNIGDDPANPDSDFDDYLETTWGVDPMLAADYEDQGWYFVDTARTQVRLTGKLCDAIQAGELTTVNTQVACACTLTGDPCQITAGYEMFTNEQIENMRCTKGVYECVDGADVCVGTDDPLPEICNGIDDNCDGIVDNMDSGQSEWEPWEDSGNDAQSLHCNFRNVCMCPDGPDTRVAAGASYQEHIDSWTGACTCGEGLSSASTDSVEHATPSSTSPQSGSACSITSAGSRAGLGFLLLGLFGLFLRRRIVT